MPDSGLGVLQTSLRFLVWFGPLSLRKLGNTPEISGRKGDSQCSTWICLIFLSTHLKGWWKETAELRSYRKQIQFISINLRLLRACDVLRVQRLRKEKGTVSARRSSLKWEPERNSLLLQVNSDGCGVCRSLTKALPFNRWGNQGSVGWCDVPVSHRRAGVSTAALPLPTGVMQA